MPEPAENPKIKIPSAVLEKAFYAAVILLIVFSHKPNALPLHPDLGRTIGEASNRGYIVPASPLEPLRPLLPRTGKVSFITDRPFEEDIQSMGIHHDAENFFAPLVINKVPEEPLAIVSCSDAATAAWRLEETGYAWIHPIDASKGLAGKKP